MIKQIAWNTFKKTGDIETYLELKQFENVLSGTGTRGMSLNETSLKGQTNIEEAVNNFWDNVNKG